MMPKMSGFEVCETLRKQYSVFDLPVLMLTAKNQPKDAITGLTAGANDYVLKPFSKEELLARTKTLLDLKQAVNKALYESILFNRETNSFSEEFDEIKCTVSVGVAEWEHEMTIVELLINAA